MKMKTEDIAAALMEARRKVPTQSKWAHYKGGYYLVVGYGFDTERETLNVSYRRIGGPNFSASFESGIRYHRPLSDWTEGRFKEVLG